MHQRSSSPTYTRTRTHMIGIDDLHHNQSRPSTTKTPPRSVLQSTDLQTQLQLQMKQQQEESQPTQQGGVSTNNRNQVTHLDRCR